MGILLIFVGYILGLIVFGGCVIQLLTIVRFGIPYTKRLEQEGLLTNAKAILRGHYISATILTAIFITCTSLAHFFFGSALLIGYYLGYIFTLFVGFGKTGETPDNISDYIRSNSGSMNLDATTEFVRNVNGHTETEKIVQAFGKVLAEECPKIIEKYPALVLPESLLPYPKQRIERALQSAIDSTQDEQNLQALTSSRAFLSSFISDKEANSRNAKILRNPKYKKAVSEHK